MIAKSLFLSSRDSEERNIEIKSKYDVRNYESKYPRLKEDIVDKENNNETNENEKEKKIEQNSVTILKTFDELIKLIINPKIASKLQITL